MDRTNPPGKGWRNALKYAGGVTSVGVALATFSNSAAASCEYKIITEWNSGFLANIRVTNDTSSTVDGWDVNWLFNGDNRVRNSWSAMIEGDNPQTARNRFWNGTLSPGESVTFGFVGKSAGATEIPELSGSLCNGDPVVDDPVVDDPVVDDPVVDDPVVDDPVVDDPVVDDPVSGGEGMFRVNSSGQITKNGQAFPLQCGNWFGLEGQHEPNNAEKNAGGAPLELYVGNMWWANGGQGTGRTIEQTMKEISAQGINTVRLPIAPQTLNADDPQGQDSVMKNHQSVRSGNARQSMENFITLADQNNIEVIIDIHSCSNYVGWRAGRLDATPPYADANREGYDLTREEYACGPAGPGVTVQDYNESIWLDNLREIAGLQEKLGVDNIIGIDIFNEPWDYTWEEWKTLAEHAYQAINEVNSDVLVFVEGVGASTSDGTKVPHGDESSNPNWGENLYMAGTQPLNIPKDRLVLSPHTYGPSVFVQNQFMDPGQPECANLEGDEAGRADCNIVIDPAKSEAGWQEHFGYLKDQGYALVVGEFGGNMDWPNNTRAAEQAMWSHVQPGVDQQWQKTFVNYLVEKEIPACYWSINPESGDTGGWYNHAYVPDVNESGWGTWEGMDPRKTSLLKTLWGTQ